MTKSKAQRDRREAEEREDAINNLREWLVNVDEIRTVCVHRSRTGSWRLYKILVGANGYKVHDISWAVAQANIGTGWDGKYGGVRTGGYGNDLVYAIGRAVTGDEPWACRGEDARCGSNEHDGVDGVARDERIMHTGDGGYRFKHDAL